MIIPGGPGAASIALYRGLRRRAAADGLDVIMVEHRGVGMSRHDDDGADLPPEALTIDQVVDDVAAVLDDAGVDSAVIYGTSYGTYLAAGVGVRHPDRVHAMVLDSPLLSADDIDASATPTRRVLWDGDDPETAELWRQGPPARRRRRADARGRPARRRPCTGSAGPELLRRQLDLLLSGRDWLWGAWPGCAAAVRAQDAVPQRARPRRPDRLSRTQLRRRARRQAARSGGRLSRVRHAAKSISSPNPTT